MSTFLGIIGLVVVIFVAGVFLVGIFGSAKPKNKYDGSLFHGNAAPVKWKTPKPMANRVEMPELTFATKYDFSSIMAVSYSADADTEALTSYLLEGGNRQRAVDDLLSLNPYLGRAKIREEKLRFSPSGGDYNNGDYTRLVIMPPTKTGKTPKFPVRLIFTTFATGDSVTKKSGFHGDVHYTQDGAIGKYKIYHTSWSSGDCVITTYADNLTIKT